MASKGTGLCFNCGRRVKITESIRNWQKLDNMPEDVQKRAMKLLQITERPMACLCSVCTEELEEVLSWRPRFARQ